MKTFQIILNNEVIGVEKVAKFMNESAVVVLAERLGYPANVCVKRIK